MKTAEEWTQHYINRLLFTHSTREEKVEAIKQIQLDAWKQGMADAAEYVRTQGIYSIRSPMGFYAQAILKNRDDRKVI